MAKTRAPEPPTFEDWTNRLKVYNDYIKALADYKKASADAMLKQAEAAAQWEQVRAMRVVIRQLELELKRLNQQTGRVAKEVKRQAELGKRASLLLSGKRLALFARSWAAYQKFEIKALLQSTIDLYTISVPSNARAASNYLNNRDPGRPCQELPDDVNTALALASWLQAQRYMARSGGAAHHALTLLFRAINEVAKQEIKELQDALDQMRKGTYDAWKPPTIIGVPAKLRRAGIEQAFVSKAPRMRSVPLPRRAWPATR